MDPFVGEIRAFGFGFAPQGWAVCAGQSLRISQNTALFSLLGVQYGGDGRSTFNLPDLMGKVAVNQGQGPGLSSYGVGQTAGEPDITLQGNQMPAHTHSLNATNTLGTATAPSGAILAQAGTQGSRVGPGNQGKMYSSNAGNVTTAMASQSIGLAGGGGAHNNMQPYVALNYCIALVGVYPLRQ